MSWTNKARGALAFALIFSAAACDCSGTKIGQASTGVSMLDPAGPPDQFQRSIDFGTVRVGHLAKHSIVLRNDGNVSAHITRADLVTTSGDFFLANAHPLPLLEPKAEFTMELRYLPSDIGADTAQIIVETDDSDTPKYTIDVNGKGASSQIDVCSTDDSGAEICASTAPGGQLVVNVGEAKPGNTVKKSLVIKNGGDAAVTVSHVLPTDTTSSEITTAAGAGVTARNDGSFDIASQKNATYDVVYQPVDGGPDDGFIEVLSDDPSNPRILVEVKAMGDAPKLCVDPTSIEFGDQALGATGHKTLTLSSCGKEPVSIDALILVNPDAGNVFALNAPPATPHSIAPGDKVDLDVTYTPNAFRDDQGQLTLRFTDVAPGIGRIPIHGRGVGCSLQAVPNPVNFGSVSQGGRTSKTITVRNTGTGDCTVNAVSTPNAPFSLDQVPTVPATIPTGQATTIQVGFAPTSQGSFHDTVNLDTSAGNVAIPLSGSGIAAPPCDLQAQPSSLVFTNVSTGQTATQNVLLKNFGTDECDIVSGKILPGATSAAFSASVSGFPPPSVPAGGSFTVPVTFKPTQAGQANGTLEIMYNSGGGTPCFPPLPCTGTKLDVSLEGGTLPPQICISPTDLDFGQVQSGTTKQMNFTITSCGQGALGLRGIALAPGSNRDFTISGLPHLPAFLAPNQTANITVTFGPHTANPEFGQVIVLNNDAQNPRAPVKLHGNATTICDKQLACNVDTLVFPTMEIGRGSTLTVACTDVGTQPVTVNGVQFSSGTSGEFKGTIGHVPTTIQPGGTVRLSVTYTPQDAGNDVGQLQIKSDACQVALVGLQGAGKTPNYPKCIQPQPFQPVTKWEWHGGSTNASSNNVEMAPIVVNTNDDNGDGRIDENDAPDVIFTSCRSGECCINCLSVGGGSFANMDDAGKGSLRAVSGKDGHDLWTVTDPALQLTAEAQLAAGDLDGDNIPEIIAVKYSFQPGSGSTGMNGKYKSGDLLVFDNTGKLKFETEPWTGDDNDVEFGSAPTIADIDGDGAVEIMFERTVFNNDGTRRFDVPYSGDDGHGGFPNMLDLDGDGVTDIIYGNYAYKNDGTLKWKANAQTGLTMVLDVDLDGKPEVVLRDAPDTFRVLDAATGAQKYGPFHWAIPDDGICSAPMAAADVDGDKKPDIIVPSGDLLHVFNATTGQELWNAAIDDHGGQCGASGAAAFDFEGDGTYDVVYHDTAHMYVFNSKDGSTLYDAPRSSSTLFETPVIADVDNDGHADLVMTNENGVSPIASGQSGIKVLSNTGNNWPATKRIWNEHGYHQSNVNENGSIPRVEQPSWQSNNDWRANPPLCRP